MRVVLLAAAALALASGADTAPAATPAPVDVAFWTRLAGVGVFVDADRNVVRIERTDDGGRTWRLVSRDQFAYSIGVTPGTRRAWVETRPAPCPYPATINCYPHLVRSDDGGRTWRATRVTASAEVAFAGTTGWASPTYGQRLWQTRDRGDTWHRRANPCGRDQVFATFATPDSGRLLCAGEPGAGSQRKRLFATADGGRTWTRSAPLSSVGYAGGILFTTPRDGWIWRSRAQPLRTHDGGRTWRIAPLRRHWNGEDAIRDMAAAGGRLWRVVGSLSNRYSLERSDDDGMTWRRIRG